jgi:Kef-type K+ transport system membrane component KefB
MNVFAQLALVLTLSSFFGYIIHRFKLPLVVGYLIAGVAISGLSLVYPYQFEVFSFLPELGIAFVLFLIGMELDLREIRSLGLPILSAALGQILISTFAGYALAGFLGFGHIESIYMGLGLSFSSTIVVIKLLLEKKELTSLYGKLSVGILLVEDMMAIAALMIISVSSSALNLGLQESLPLISLVLKAIGLFILTFVLSRFVLEKIFDQVAQSVELLFLTAVTWCFLFTTLAVFSGFSVVIGAFLAGVALASSPYHLQIQGKIKPLRDFFVTLFFVYLGSQVRINDIFSNALPILLLTLYAIAIKPFLYMLIVGIFGFRKHTIFQTGLNLSQISEFSLIVLLIGVNMKIVSPTSLSVMSAVAVISIILSSIMITYANKIYKAFSPFMHFLEHSSKVHYLEAKVEQELAEHVIIVGGQGIGGPVIKFFKEEKISFIVVDFNPHIVEKLRNNHLNVIYGDISDPEILDNIQIDKAKLIISTAADIGANESLLDECKRRKVKAKIIVRALDDAHTKELKNLGADYVISPEKVSANYLVDQLQGHWPEIVFKELD